MLNKKKRKLCVLCLVRDAINLRYQHVGISHLLGSCQSQDPHEGVCFFMWWNMGFNVSSLKIRFDK